MSEYVILVESGYPLSGRMEKLAVAFNFLPSDKYRMRNVRGLRHLEYEADITVNSSKEETLYP